MVKMVRNESHHSTIAIAACMDHCHHVAFVIPRGATVIEWL